MQRRCWRFGANRGARQPASCCATAGVIRQAPRPAGCAPRCEGGRNRHRAQPGRARDARGKIPHGRPPNRALFTPNLGHGRSSPGGGGGAQAAIAGPTPPPSACAPRLRLGAAPGDTPRRPHPCPARLGPVSFLALGKIQSPGGKHREFPRLSIHPSQPAGRGGRDGCVKCPGGAGVRSPSPSSPPGMAAGCWQRGAGTRLLPGACSKRCHKDIRQPQQSGWARSSPTRSPSPSPQAPRPPKQLRCEAVGMSPVSLPSICSDGSHALHLKPSPSPRAWGWGLRLLLGPIPTGGTEPPRSASGALEYGKRRGKAFSVRPQTHPSGMGRGGGEGSPKS